jgi:hypothetical protein
MCTFLFCHLVDNRVFYDLFTGLSCTYGGGGEFLLLEVEDAAPFFEKGNDASDTGSCRDLVNLSVERFSSLNFTLEAYVCGYSQSVKSYSRLLE